jgi:hypothetical protein
MATKFHSINFADKYEARTTADGHIEITQTMNGFVVADTFRNDGRLHLFFGETHLGPVANETEALLALDRAICNEWV